MLTINTTRQAGQLAAQLRGLVEVTECHSGACPQYVADEHSEIPLTVRTSASR
jgi:hypothetical protein